MFKISLDLLQSPSLPYHQLYTNLIDSSKRYNFERYADEQSAQIFNEVFLMLALRLKSFVKIRKYSELEKELEGIQHLEFHEMVPLWFSKFS